MFGQYELWEINREERFYCALLAHAILSSAQARVSICNAINSSTGSQLTPDKLEVYVEIAALRDYWNRLDSPLHAGALDPKLDVLQRIFEEEKLAPSLLDNSAFRTSTGKIPNPGHWNIEAICEAFPEHALDGNWLDRIKKIKWSFNAKPDLLFISGDQAVFVEAKVESGEDKYEGRIPQTEVQAKIARFIQLLAPRYHTTKFFNTMLLLERDTKCNALVWSDLVGDLEQIHLEHPDELDAFSMRCLKQLVYNNPARPRNITHRSGLAADSKAFSTETLSPIFLLKVLNKLDHDPDAVVRFGTTGKGVRPNYEITCGNGGCCSYKGTNHERLPASEIYDSQQLTAPISQEQLVRLIDEMVKPEIAQEWMARFYTANKQHYPQGIRQYRDELLRLIAEGSPVKKAFDYISEKYALA